MFCPPLIIQAHQRSLECVEMRRALTEQAGKLARLAALETEAAELREERARFESSQPRFLFVFRTTLTLL